MNLLPRWIAALSNAGCQAVHWSTVGPSDASDVEIMNFAAENEYVVLTHDLDFGAILAATHGKKPCVVQIRSDDVSPVSIGPQVISALLQLENEFSQGALVSVDPKRSRVRLVIRQVE